MRIRLNGEPKETTAKTLSELCAALGHGEGAIATAVNGGFVPRDARVATRLSEADEIEIVAPRQGG